MGNSLEYGNRPFLVQDASKETFEALRACPGIELSHNFESNSAHQNILNQQLIEGWGPILEVWEGYAADEEIRFAGSSGGVATALALYCLEQKGMSGVLHISADSNTPLTNETVFSKSRSELLSRAGSRYAPASPAESLSLIEDSSNECVFIGKPCDVVAVQNARKLRLHLDKKTGFTISFFCAGVPSTKGTLDLLKNHGITYAKSVRSLRYRGNGWPGSMVADYQDEFGKDMQINLSYEESWGYLEKYRQWRCYICPDHTGEFSDIAVGDPWYRECSASEPGRSLIVARSMLGLEILREASELGYLRLETKDASLLPRSQSNLLKTRSSLWGRLLVLKIFSVPVPVYTGFCLFSLWIDELNIRGKLQSILGTAKRIFRKRLLFRAQISEWNR